MKIISMNSSGKRAKEKQMGKSNALYAYTKSDERTNLYIYLILAQFLLLSPLGLSSWPASTTSFPFRCFDASYSSWWRISWIWLVWLLPESIRIPWVWFSTQMMKNGGFTSEVDGKNSILAAVSTRSSSDEVLGVSLVRIGRCWRQFLHRIENFDFNIDNRWVR